MSTIAITVRNQTVVSVVSQRAVSDSINYLALKCQFTADWDGLLKTVIFTRGETAVTLVLDEHDCYTAERGINLPSGDWDIKIVGIDSSDGEVKQRITANGQILRVNEFGSINGAPPTEIAPEYGEQIAAIAHDAKVAALAARKAAENARDGAIVSAEAAAKSEKNARISETAARQYEDKARISSEAAFEFKELAASSAETAVNAAEEASGYLAGVKSDADRASGAAEEARVSEINAVASADIAKKAQDSAWISESRAAASAAAAEAAKNSMSYVTFTMRPDGHLIMKNAEVIGATSFRLLGNGHMEVEI